MLNLDHIAMYSEIVLSKNNIWPTLASKYFNIYPQNEVFQCYHVKAAAMQMHVDLKGIGECLAYLTQNKMVPDPSKPM
jgi:hypothetical protein